MEHIQQAVPSQLATLPPALHYQALSLIDAPASPEGPVPPIVVRSPGLFICRCGHCLSEDFDGRLFCRGCEGTDPHDITPRLPLRHRRR